MVPCPYQLVALNGRPVHREEGSRKSRAGTGTQPATLLAACGSTSVKKITRAPMSRWLVQSYMGSSSSKRHTRIGKKEKEKDGETASNTSFAGLRFAGRKGSGVASGQRALSADSVPSKPSNAQSWSQQTTPLLEG